MEDDEDMEVQIGPGSAGAGGAVWARRDLSFRLMAIALAHPSYIYD